jgi:formylglycine-generating enzyme required for sulfatase activity
LAALMVAQPDWAEDLAAIDSAARNAGIVPGDPGYAFVCGMTRVLDKFGQRLDAALKQLEDAPRQAPLELLPREATDAVDQHVALPGRYHNQRTLVRISTAWALTMLVGMGATYWAGYSMGSLHQRNSEQSALLPEPTTNASPATTAMTLPDAASGNAPQARAATEVSGPPIAMAAVQPPGSTAGSNRFQDCSNCPWMVRIPAGGFIMGQGAHESEAIPPHHVDIHAFAMSQAPVTVADWKTCMVAKACNFMPRMRAAEDRTPLHNVSWEDVDQYIAWISDIAGHPYRLPSEAEWEYAARGGTITRYWWGDSVGTFLANCNDCGGAQDTHGPLPVDVLQPNPYGLYGVLGGVAQWVADCWFPSYRGAPANSFPREAKVCDKRVLRGGSFRASRDEITVTYRGNYDASVRYIVNGFRVARDTE